MLKSFPCINLFHAKSQSRKETQRILASFYGLDAERCSEPYLPRLGVVELIREDAESRKEAELRKEAANATFFIQTSIFVFTLGT